MSGRPGIATEQARVEAGLPEALPPGERILWQGRPDAFSLARHSYGTRLIAAWFVLVTLARVATTWSERGSLGAISQIVIWSLLPALLALAILAVVARLQARAACYTLTDRRIAMRVGVALPATVNIPLAKIESVDRRLLADGRCDLVLSLEGGNPLGAALLWPHVRLGLRGREVQPVLRCLDDPETVSRRIADALVADAASREAASPRVVPFPVRRRPDPDAAVAAALASPAIAGAEVGS